MALGTAVGTSDGDVLGAALGIADGVSDGAEDGVALSSRNAYLSEEERREALALPRALGEAARQMEKGATVEAALARAVALRAAHGFDPIDYVSLCDAVTLEPMTVLDRPARLLGAAKRGKTRLIDNIPVDPL